jgi:hypothetical protein
MPVDDDTRPLAGRVLPGQSLTARCEGCELVYVFDLLAELSDVLVDCEDCGSPLYAIAEADEAVFHAGFGAGWDACAAFVQAMTTGDQLDELTAGGESAVRLGGGL